MVHRNSFLNYEFYDTRSHVIAHTVVQSSSCQNDFRMVTRFLRLLCEIVRVNSNTVTAHQTRFEIQKVPFCTRGSQNGLRINVEYVEYFRQFVHERNVDIPL